MENIQEETHSKITPRKKYSKEELILQFWEQKKELAMNKIPRAYRNKGFDELEGDTMKKIAAKLKTWDAKSQIGRAHV